MKISKVIEKAHTGTVVACISLATSNREVIITQDDSRELRVWIIENGFSEAVIKTIGRSYNPVWLPQSLVELFLDDPKNERLSQPELHFLSAQGADSKVIQFKIDLEKKELIAV